MEQSTPPQPSPSDQATTQPQTPPQPASPQPVPPKPKKPFPIAGILLGFLVFGVGGYLLGSKGSLPVNFVPNPYSTIQPSPSPEISPSPTASSSATFGPESLWSRTQGKAKEFLANHVSIQPPVGWAQIDCDSSLNFNFEESVRSCSTEFNAFYASIFPDSPYIYEQYKVNESNRVSKLVENLEFGGKQAVQFDYSNTLDDIQFTTKITVIFYSDDTYIYVVLNNSTQETNYTALLNSLSFN